MADDGVPSHHCYCVWVLFITRRWCSFASLLLHMGPFRYHSHCSSSPTLAGFCRHGTSNTVLHCKLRLHRSQVAVHGMQLVSFSLCKFPKPPNFNPPNAIHNVLEPIRQIQSHQIFRPYGYAICNNVYSNRCISMLCS